MVDIYCVPPERTVEIWPAVAPLIRSALSKTLTDFDIVSRDILDGRMLLWLGWDGMRVYGAAVTQVTQSNGKRFCTIVACGGEELNRWRYLIGRLEQYAKDEDCRSVVIMGREGWERVYPEYRRVSVTLEKEL